MALAFVSTRVAALREKGSTPGRSDVFGAVDG